MELKPYEISVWDDVLTYVVKNGDTTSLVTSLDGIEGEVINQFYDEQKLCIIGSNTMTSPARALNPTLTRNVNGQVTLDFQMYRRYYDNEKEEKVDNSFINLLVNERKIKVKYDEKWYDLIIKNVDEESDSYLQKYTATSLQINELSKTGFNLVLDTELENNTGTVIELAKKAVAETDWTIDEENSDSLVQTIEEPLYAITLNYDSGFYSLPNIFVTGTYDNVGQLPMLGVSKITVNSKTSLCTLVITSTTTFDVYSDNDYGAYGRDTWVANIQELI